MRIFLLRPVDILQRRFKEWSVRTTGRSVTEHVLRLSLGRRTLPW